MASIEIRNLNVSYGRKPVLRDVGISFASGRVTVLAGPNGCGKSTLLKAVMGLLPFNGEICIDGELASSIDRRAFARRVAYLPQECHCPDHMTLGELVELGGYARYSLLRGPTERDRSLFRRALETVGLADKAADYVNTLSGGQRQRAWIAMVLAQDPDTILLDEPVNHLDMKYQYSVLGLIRSMSEEFGKTVIVVLHDLNLAAAFADDVVMMKDGRIVASGPSAQTISTDTVAQVFDLETDVFLRDNRLVCLPRVPGRAAVPA
jgi:iron complex transport system ATP-binding protein